MPDWFLRLFPAHAPAAPVVVWDLLLLALCAGLFFFGWRYFKADRFQRPRARFRRERLGVACGGVVALFLLAGLADCLLVSPTESVLDFAFRGVPQEGSYSAPLARVDFNERDPKPLAGWHLMGTDLLGKDIFQQILKGCKTALIIGGLTSLLYLPIGTLLGILGGYYRRWVDDLIQYLYSTLASIPGILLLIAFMMAAGRGLDRMALALSLTAWIGLCRLVRGETLRQAARPYVDAARALGQSNAKIILHHILPNVMHLVVISAILGFSGLVLMEAMLSYLGVGVPVGTASWGSMIDAARMELSRTPTIWWPFAASTGALFVLVLSLNLLGEALRRAFDPKG